MAKNLGKIWRKTCGPHGEDYGAAAKLRLPLTTDLEITACPNKQLDSIVEELLPE
ncbi:MAG: hypothetical protein JNK57_11960 [Planctomycetaceae bacterium]|nr:hypothetical protein [Planctomycetaceae bacterium]